MKTPTNEDKQTISTLSIAIVMTALAGLMAISITTAAMNVNAQVPGVTPPQDQEGSTSAGGGEQANTVTIQKTAESTVDPLPGHSAHQLVMALPPRDDGGQVWIGTVTWSASKPVEVVVLHGYNSTVKPDASHGSPLTAPIGPGKEVAISLIKTNSGTPVASGSMRFVGNAVAFHTLSGDKFTVTYSLDAMAKPLTQ